MGLFKKGKPTYILTRRFKTKKAPISETVDINGFSKYANLIAPRYFDSDVFAHYEATFPRYATDFFSRSGADRFNHDALDCEIDKKYSDEVSFYAEQYIRHMDTLNRINIGVLQEIESVRNRIIQVESQINGYRSELGRLSEKYEEYNRKGDE